MSVENPSDTGVSGTTLAGSDLSSYVDNQLNLQNPDPDQAKVALGFDTLERERERDQIEQSKIETLIKKHIADGHQASLESYRQDTKQRKEFSDKIFSFLVGWTIFVCSFIMLAGVKVLDVGSEVLITLLGTTTVSIVGIFMAVAKYLFPVRHKSDKPE